MPYIENDGLNLHRTRVLPARDPAQSFAPDSELSVLDELGRDLPSLLEDSSFRRHMQGVRIPESPENEAREETLARAPALLRAPRLPGLGLHQPGGQQLGVLPPNLAVPLCDVCAAGSAADAELRRLCPVQLEAVRPAGRSRWATSTRSRTSCTSTTSTGSSSSTSKSRRSPRTSWRRSIGLAHGLRERNASPSTERFVTSRGRSEAGAVLRRIPEKMDPALYYRTFRPYIRFFEGVVYEGVDTPR